MGQALGMLLVKSRHVMPQSRDVINGRTDIKKSVDGGDASWSATRVDSSISTSNAGKSNQGRKQIRGQTAGHMDREKRRMGQRGGLSGACRPQP